jgi:WXG100 family type VII secretion target
MAKILVTPEEMDRIAGQFTSGAQQSQEISSRLNSAIQSMQGQWEGMTQNKFFQRYEADKKSMDKYVEMLNDVAKELTEIAKRFRLADQQS